MTNFMKKRIILPVLISIFSAANLLAENVITMKTQRSSGEKIQLQYDAEGPVEVVGAENPVYDESGRYVYTLTGNEISITGDLNYLFCPDNNIVNLDISRNTLLTNLDCSNNNLTAVDVTANVNLLSLNCANNQIKALNIKQNTNLGTLNIANNQLETIDLTANKMLTVLTVTGNMLNTLDVSNNISLLRVYCEQNQLTELDFSTNTKMKKLYCGKNPLTILNVSKNKALEYLSYSGSDPEVDISLLSNLTTLDCTGGNITSLDVGKNTKLKQLRCYFNNISGEEMDKLISSLPDRSSTGVMGNFFVHNNVDGLEKNVCTNAQVEAAKNRGWTARTWNGTNWIAYEGTESSDIESQLTDDAEVANIYNMEGCRIPELQKGMNIVRRNDGNVSKVLKR